MSEGFGYLDAAVGYPTNTFSDSSISSSIKEHFLKRKVEGKGRAGQVLSKTSQMLFHLSLAKCMLQPSFWPTMGFFSQAIIAYDLGSLTRSFFLWDEKLKNIIIFSPLVQSLFFIGEYGLGR